jgi:hypothetical protein
MISRQACPLSTKVDLAMHFCDRERSTNKLRFIKLRRLLLATLLWPAFGLFIPFACSQEQGKSKESNSKPSGYQNLDFIFSLIESDLKSEAESDRVRNKQERLKLLASGYESKAKSGDLEAQFKIGAMCLEGLGNHANYGEAAHWFSLAGGRDHPLAQLAQGRHYLKCRDDDARNTQVRERAIEALGKIGPAAELSIPILTQKLGDGWPLGNAAAMALGRIGGRGIWALVESLVSKDVRIRREAAESLLTAGVVAFPRLIVLLNRKDVMVQELVQCILEQLRSREAQK